jgi:hypothetical protein
MRALRTILIAVVALGVAGIAGAAGPMTLTRTGDLYTAGARDNTVVVTIQNADGTLEELAVPQSAAAVPSSVQVGVDEVTGGLYILWQKKSGLDARLRLAGYLDGTWIGPTTFAGNDGTAAYNPQLLLHRAVSTITEDNVDGGEPVETEIATTFLHLVWWSQTSEYDPGVARYVAVALDQEGVPQFRDAEIVDLIDFLPYGIACSEIENVDNLRHPKLFVDPKTGNPHVFATDIPYCIFQILELQPEIVEEEGDDETDKRRRQIIILRQGTMIAMRSDLPFATGRLEIGRGLKLIMHWDAEEDGVLNYLELDRDGISATKRLVLGDGLNHEQAVDLIRGLTK